MKLKGEPLTLAFEVYAEGVTCAEECGGVLDAKAVVVVDEVDAYGVVEF